LDQEESKKFLTGKPEDKYNFFLKATERKFVGALLLRFRNRSVLPLFLPYNISLQKLCRASFDRALLRLSFRTNFRLLLLTRYPPYSLFPHDVQI